ncbi:SRPBCC family protein [Pseudonocardia lacus]|uniref:SRPBCC family protein n=1 Tax=Pseudonocardia lacus TaxID=2835865 RepID=UPI001BDDA215|nr:SRPBCC family protein [Pseudonocardia lacus]
MQLENKFTIEAPIEKAWEALNTPQTIAPCFPGATLTEYEGDSFTGTVKVKLGPISLTYKGKGTYVSRDEEAHKVIIEASGRDSRGNGTASATVTGSMVADGPDKTAVTMVTDMTITGRPAQFGRGVISDVADKIIGQFASCVAEKLTPQATDAPAASGGSASSAAPAAAGSPNGTSSSTAKPTSGTATGIVPSTTATTTAGATKPASTASPSGPMKSEIDAIDLLDTAGAPVLKRLAPVIAGGLLLLIIFLIRRSRSGS